MKTSLSCQCRLMGWLEVRRMMAPCLMKTFSEVPRSVAPSSVSSAHVPMMEGMCACSVTVVFVRTIQRNRTKTALQKWPFSWVGWESSQCAHTVQKHRTEESRRWGCHCVSLSLFWALNRWVMMQANTGRPSQPPRATNRVQHLAVLWLHQAATERTAHCFPGQRPVPPSLLCSFFFLPKNKKAPWVSWPLN